MLIRTVGLFWKRADVLWGKKKDPGKLLGIQRDAKKDDPVDFWNQAGVYALYAANYDLLYVGQAGSGDQRLGVRLRQHLTDDLSERWELFSWFGVGWVKGDCTLAEPAEKKIVELPELLDHLDGIAIAISEPKLNRQGASFGSGVERYVQLRDSRLGYTDRELLERISSSLGDGKDAPATKV